MKEEGRDLSIRERWEMKNVVNSDKWGNGSHSILRHKNKPRLKQTKFKCVHVVTRSFTDMVRWVAC